MKGEAVARATGQRKSERKAATPRGATVTAVARTPRTAKGAATKGAAPPKAAHASEKPSKATRKRTAGGATRKSRIETAVQEPDASVWIIREVAFATYKSEDEASAGKLAESLRLLERGVEEWNRFRETHPDFRPYLRNANLSWTNKHIPELSGINLSHADLTDVSFEGQALTGADLSYASL